MSVSSLLAPYYIYNSKSSQHFACLSPQHFYNMSYLVTIMFITVAVPNPPSNLRATMHTATSITITWTDTTTNIDRYEVTYSYTVRRCSTTPGPAMTNTVTSTARSHILMNLNEDSTYITVRNINGAASNMSTITANTSTAGNHHRTSDLINILCIHSHSS